MPPVSPAAQRRVPWWMWPNVLSLDAPVVAVLWQAALARVSGVALPEGCHLALGLAVWLIYMVDRVLDGFSMGEQPVKTMRHAFYQRYRWYFVFGVLPLGTLALGWVSLTAIPEGILWRGVGLSFVVGMYLLHYAARGHSAIYLAGNALTCVLGAFFIWSLPLPLTFKLFFSSLLLGLTLISVGGRSTQGFRFLPKEALCGYIFAIGCSMSVHFYSLDKLADPVSPETLLLALLCTLNCIAIACYERETDVYGDRNAITQTWPLVARFYPALLVLLILGLSYLLTRASWVALPLYTLAVLASLLLLGGVHLLAKRFSPEFSHVLADLAVALPMIAVLVWG